MKRTTVVLPDHLASRLNEERRRRGVSASAIIREALERCLPRPPLEEPPGFIGLADSRELKIAALGASQFMDTSAQLEEILEKECGSAQGYMALVHGEEFDAPIVVVESSPDTDDPIAASNSTMASDRSSE
jgi:hypothetical protein